MNIHQKNFFALLTHLNISQVNQDIFKTCWEIKSLIWNKTNLTGKIYLKQIEIVPFKLISILQKKLKSHQFKITFVFGTQGTLQNNCENIKSYLLHYLSQQNKESINNLTSFQINQDNTLMCQFHDFEVDKLKLQKFFQKYGIYFDSLVVDCSFKNKSSKTQSEKTKIFEYQKNLEVSKIKKQYLSNIAQSIQTKEVSRVFYRKIKIKGRILKIREWIVKNNQNLEILFDCLDQKACFVVCRNFKDQNLDLLKVKAWISFEGYFYPKNNKFYSSKWEAISPIFTRFDQEVEKRVELHLHTKMSSLDGIGSLEDYMAYVDHWNHKAIAITDHENVHVFAKCEQLQKKYSKIKIIYGCEFNFLRNDHWVVNQQKDLLLREQKLMFFDVETTGLSIFFDEIIEFAYIIVKNGLTLEKGTFFIKSKQKISQVIFDLTKIDPQKYRQLAISKELAASKIKKIINDNILIAHNAKFDLGFINRLFELYKIPKITNITIDTLNLSRVLDPELFSHRLGRVAKKYKIWSRSEKSHRALYDSEILKKTFYHMVDQNKISSLKELYLLNNDQKIINKGFPNHLILLAKNRQGLQDLYRLISQTHTKTLYRNPVLKIEDLENNRQNFLIGSCCYNGEVFEAALWNDDHVLQQKIKFYDYLEIQPIEVYMHFVSKKRTTKENIKKAILRIIKFAKKLNKKVVATGDVHYVNPEDVFYRNVFVFNKQLGGKFHPLFVKNNKPETPLQYLRTTSEMLQAFSFLNNQQLIKEIVVKNSCDIADQIEKFAPFQKKFIMPKWKGHDQELIILANQKLHQKYGQIINPLLKKRFDFELQKIINFGYTTIYLISYALTNFSIENGYLFGSRGSVGSSFLAFCLDITEVNPLPPHYLCRACFYFEWSDDKNINSGFDLKEQKCPKCHQIMYKDGHNIEFSSFLGLNFTNVPDIDLNFSGQFQQKAQQFVINFLNQKLGELKVFRTGTISTVAERLAYNYFHTYLENYDSFLDRKYLKLEEAQKSKIIHYCSGIKKTTGQHPGGLMIIAKECNIFDYTPYNFPSNNNENDNYTTHFDYRFLHNKLLKIDVLGHDDPTGLKLLHEMTKQNPIKINLSDPKIFKLFCDGEVLNFQTKQLKSIPGVIGIPEFGTKFVIKMLKSVNVKSFSDLIAVSGLTHGKNVWENNAKNLIENDRSFHLGNVISCRDDIFEFLTKHNLSKEFAYQIMQKVKKGIKLVSSEIQTLKDQNIPNWYIESCQKIKYLFPKAHATAYVIMAARFAWYKIYYPHEFYAVYFTIRTNTFDLETICGGYQKILSKHQQINNLIKIDPYNIQKKVSTKNRNLLPIFEMAMEMYQRNIKLENLSLQFSEARKFIVKEINGQKLIIPPFCTIELLGEETAKKIIEERQKKDFSSWEDFKKRTKINQTAFDNLYKTGIFKNLKKSQQKSFQF